MSGIINRSSHTKPRLSGLTLIEMLIVLLLVLLLGHFSTQALGPIVARQKAHSLLEILQTSLAFARETAVHSVNIITVCPLKKLQCGEDWAHGLLIFIDVNNNRRVDKNETALKRIDFNQHSFTLTWNASGGKNYLRYSPSGNATEFGRFNLCDKKNNAAINQALVVSRMGKTRRYRDKNGDGTVEDRNGRKPDC